MVCPDSSKLTQHVSYTWYKSFLCIFAELEAKLVLQKTLHYCFQENDFHLKLSVQENIFCNLFILCFPDLNVGSLIFASLGIWPTTKAVPHQLNKFKDASLASPTFTYQTDRISRGCWIGPLLTGLLARGRQSAKPPLTKQTVLAVCKIHPLKESHVITGTYKFWSHQPSFVVLACTREVYVNRMSSKLSVNLQTKLKRFATDLFQAVNCTFDTGLSLAYLLIAI